MPITLNFKGEDTFNTTVGGIISLIVYAIVLLYSITEIQSIYGWQNTAVNTNLITRSLLNDRSKYDIANNLFFVGIGSYNSAAPDMLNDPTMLDVSFNYNQRRRESIGGTVLSETQTSIGSKK